MEILVNMLLQSVASRTPRGGRMPDLHIYERPTCGPIYLTHDKSAHDEAAIHLAKRKGGSSEHRPFTVGALLKARIRSPRFGLPIGRLHNAHHRVIAV